MRKVLASILVFVFSFLFLFASPSFAKVIADQTANVTIAKGEVINDDLFVGAKTVEILGTINGDVYVGAETVTITGIINGNLHAGGNTLKLDGTVKGNAYVGGGSVSVNGAQVGGSLLVGGGNITVDEETTISGSLLAGGGTLSIDAPVKRNVFLGAGSVNLNSVVGGEARIGAGSITLGPKAKIAKDLYYAVGEEGREVSMSDTATVAGSIHKSAYNFDQKKEFDSLKSGLPDSLRALKSISTLVTFLGALLVGFLYLTFAKKHFTETSALISKSFWKSLGIGLLVTVVSIPVLFLLLVTGIGAPLAGLAILLLLVYLYLAKLVVGLSFGTWLATRFNLKKLSLFMTFGLGLLALFVLKMVPFVAVLTNITILWAGLGALTLRLFSKGE